MKGTETSPVQLKVSPGSPCTTEEAQEDLQHLGRDLAPKEGQDLKQV